MKEDSKKSTEPYEICRFEKMARTDSFVRSMLKTANNLLSAKENKLWTKKVLRK